MAFYVPYVGWECGTCGDIYQPEEIDLENYVYALDLNS